MLLTDTSTLHLSYYADRIIVSKEPIINGSACHKKKEIMLRNRSTVYNGFMSPSTKRKVRTILTTWINAVEYENNSRDLSLMKHQRKLIFITLTLSEAQKHDDNWIKRNMLDRYLVKLQRRYNVKYYFWKAEKQKNGRIHFHIIVDHYISKEDIQMEWNEIQRNVGYMDEFFFKNRRYNAPSTDVRIVTKGQKGIDYVLKYVSKNPDDIEDASLQVKGRIWGCSSELKTLKPYSTGEDSSIGEDLYGLVLEKKIEALDHEHFQIYFIDTEDFLRKRHKRIYNDMISYYVTVYKQLYEAVVQSHVPRNSVDMPKHCIGVQSQQLSLFSDMYLTDNDLKRKRNRENH